MIGLVHVLRATPAVKITVLFYRVYFLCKMALVCWPQQFLPMRDLNVIFIIALVTAPSEINYSTEEEADQLYYCYCCLF